VALFQILLYLIIFNLLVKKSLRIPVEFNQGLSIYNDWCFLKKKNAALGHGFEDPGSTSTIYAYGFIPILYTYILYRNLLQSRILLSCIFKFYYYILFYYIEFISNKDFCIRIMSLIIMRLYGAAI